MVGFEKMLSSVFSRPWPRTRSASRRRLWWVRPADDARPYSVELGDVSAEEECLDWF